MREQTTVTSPMRHQMMPKSATLINAARPARVHGGRDAWDSQRDNTGQKACACGGKSVVITNTRDQNVNVIAELVFDMMLHSELDVIGRSIDSILNMITDASQADTARIREPRGVSPQPDPTRKKSDEDSAVAVQRG